MEIIFITYIPRSGSTFLLNELNKYNEICSLSENNAINKVLKNHFFIKKKILSFFYYCQKYTHWYFTEKEKKELLKITDKYEFFFNVLLIQQRRIKKKATILIYKNSDFLDFLLEMPQKYIDIYNVKILFLIRDLRAIYWSNVLASRYHNSFNLNPLIVTNGANNYLKYLPYLKKKYTLLELKYEELIVDYKKQIIQLLLFLFDRTVFSVGCYGIYSYINETEKKLHTNVLYPPLVQNVNKWENNIIPNNLCLLYKYASKYFKEYHYKKNDVQCNKFIIYLRFLIYKIRIFFKIDSY